MKDLAKRVQAGERVHDGSEDYQAAMGKLTEFRGQESEIQQSIEALQSDPGLSTNQKAEQLLQGAVGVGELAAAGGDRDAMNKLHEQKRIVMRAIAIIERDVENAIKAAVMQAIPTYDPQAKLLGERVYDALQELIAAMGDVRTFNQQLSRYGISKIEQPFRWQLPVELQKICTANGLDIATNRTHGLRLALKFYEDKFGFKPGPGKG